MAHLEVDHAGFEIVEMDVDTASHLHCLIELNTGDESTLAELIRVHESEAL